MRLMIAHHTLAVEGGLHTGECEIVDDDITGLAVHIGARVGALAGAGEVLVSRTVKDLVVGSGLEFHSRGTHELKGMPGNWELFALASGGTPTVRVEPEQPLMRASDRVVLATARRAPVLLRLAGRVGRS
jgi:class 3 adenylate cyclase